MMQQYLGMSFKCINTVEYVGLSKPFPRLLMTLQLRRFIPTAE